MGLLSEQEIKVLENVLATSPKAKRKIVNAVKEVVPDLPTPPDVLAAEEFDKLLDDKVKPLTETIERLQAELAKKDKDDSWSKQVLELKKNRGWSDKQVSKFIKDLEEEFKERKELTLDELAEYHDLKNRPLTPSGGVESPFAGTRSQTETEWRESVRDPNSEFMKAVRSKDNRKKKQIQSKWWKQAGEEWADMHRT